MKKLSLIIFASLFFIFNCIMAQSTSEHMKFMGIELNGTISSFHSKLLAKGMTVSPLSDKTKSGVRVYDGVFSGEKAEVIVHYNPRTNEVYAAKALITRYGKDMIEQLMNSMESKLDIKYGTQNKRSEQFQDDHLHQFPRHFYTLDNGVINLYITSTGYSSQNDFFLNIEYLDLENYQRNVSNEIEDL